MYYYFFLEQFSVRFMLNIIHICMHHAHTQGYFGLQLNFSANGEKFRFI
jgi:hypothetical protein